MVVGPLFRPRFKGHPRAFSHGSGGPQAGEVLGGVPHQGGLPGQPVRVTRFSGVSFLHVKTAEWGNSPNRGNQITRAWRVISTISPQNRQNADEIDSAGDNLGVVIG